MNNKFIFYLRILSIVSIISFNVAYASPPASPYNLGETLSPTCAPGDINCTVTPPQPHHNYLDDVSAVTAVAGDLFYFDGTNWKNLASGLAGQALTIGVGGLPEWGTAGVASLWQKVGTSLSPATSGDDILLNSGENLTIADLTPGSLIFAGTGGLISQDNTNLYWDNTNKELGIGVHPSQELEISKSMEMPETTNNTTGIIYKTGKSFLHNYPYNGCQSGVCGNTFLGLESGNFSMSTSPVMSNGSGNTGIGYQTLHNSTTGYRNTAIGSNALSSVTSGNNNNAIGSMAMQNTLTGSRNTAIGEQSLYVNTAGSDNIAIGYQALVNSSASYNVSIGSFSSTANTSGTNNVSIGRWTMYNNQAGSYNTAIGDESGSGSVASDIHRNTLIGYRTGFNSRTGANDNTYLGYRAGYNVTTGDHNIFIGSGAGYNANTGKYNIVIGNDSNLFDPSGDNQLKIGQYIYGLEVGGRKRIGIWNVNPQTTLDVAGGVKLGVENICDANREGTIRYRSGSPGHFTGCRLANDGVTYEWVQLDN